MSNYLENILNDELNILIVSSNLCFLPLLQETLHNTWKEQLLHRCFRCKIHISPNIALAVGETDQKISFDYIIYVLDMSIVSCIKEVEDSLKYLGSFGRHKIALVAQHGKVDNVTPFELWSFARFFQLNLLFSNIENSEKLLHLANRLLNLIEASCGVLNGVPLIGNV